MHLVIATIGGNRQGGMDNTGLQDTLMMFQCEQWSRSSGNTASRLTATQLAPPKRTQLRYMLKATSGLISRSFPPGHGHASLVRATTSSALTQDILGSWPKSVISVRPVAATERSSDRWRQ